MNRMFSKKNGLIALVVVIALTFVLVFSGVFSSDNSNAAANQAKSKFVDVTTVQKTPDQCVDGYNVQLDKNDGNKVISNAQAELPVDNPQLAIEKVMKYAQHDPRILVLYWNSSPLGKPAPEGDWKKLVNEGCYTSHARDVYQQLKAEYGVATVAASQAPASGVNTGVQAGGGNPFQEKPGNIGGNRTAVKVTFSNGDVIWIMKRCGNVVTQVPIPGVPAKPIPPAPPCQGCTTTTTVVPPPCKKKCKPVIPTCPNGQPIPPNGLCPKDPSKDVNLNPAVPPQVRGPGTTPVGVSPGPATPTHDTPTGCDGSCTTTTPPPSSGNSGSTPPVVPGCGDAGQPSCTNTGVTAPTTVAPAPAPPDTSSPSGPIASP